MPIKIGRENKSHKKSFEFYSSGLRQEQIKADSKHPAFYNDEARYLANKGNYNEAMDIINLAKDRGCINE